MTVVGFYFSKIEVEKKKVPKGNVNVNNNVKIINVEKTDLSLGNVKEDGLRFDLDFTSKYEPDFGEIKLKCSVLYLADAAAVKDALKKWKSDKRVAKDLVGPVMQTALSKCQMEAIVLSRDVNLPPPVGLPMVGAAKKDYIG
ncbi:hypothetical protein KY320_01090 [Candidatus Woesearchaeota archaeon]|nr:hypothetical protein [Candidatus Woesearchaeota archaeon]